MLKKIQTRKNLKKVCTFIMVVFIFGLVTDNGIFEINWMGVHIKSDIGKMYNTLIHVFKKSIIWMCMFLIAVTMIICIFIIEINKTKRKEIEEKQKTARDNFKEKEKTKRKRIQKEREKFRYYYENKIDPEKRKNIRDQNL